ncbi:MAG: serine hydrolase [Flavobacteriales bacterium]|nr:serine hydrolase [Flavobacteriales bacterium]
MKFRILFILILGILFIHAVQKPHTIASEIPESDWASAYGPDFIQQESYFILGQIDRMSLEEKIAQLCFVRSESVKNKKQEKKISNLIKKYGIGGITFFKGNTPDMQYLMKKYQKLSKVPLLFSIDGEWGASMRLENMPVYPWMMTMGAVQDNKLVEMASEQMAKEFKNIGIHMNLAPDIDVNNNPNNPIINVRSFGEDPWNVAKKGTAYMKGHDKEKILTVAKHFPGHGDTDMDSHKTLPKLPFTRNRLDSIELIPFRYLIQQGMSSIMVAHLNIPNITKKEQLPSSVSPHIVDSLLKYELAFKGLTMTDGLAMRGVQDHLVDGRLELEALKAGNDVLLLPQNVKAVIDTVKMGIQNGEYSLKKLDRSVLKVLLMKTFIGLDHQKDSLVFKKVDFEKAAWVKEKIMENALTLLENKVNILPFRTLEKQNFALIISGKEHGVKQYLDAFNFYQKPSIFYLNASNFKNLPAFLKKNKGKEIIFSIHKSDASPWKPYKTTSTEQKALKKLAKHPKTHLVLFANPYALRKQKISGYQSILIAYQNNKEAQKLVPEALFGGRTLKGKLPVGISEKYSVGAGIETKKLDVLKQGLPLDFNLRKKDFAKVDSIVNDAIKKKAIPGCQLLVAKDGKVFFEKNYGHFTYEKKKKVQTSSLYDIASITKIAGTMPIIMKLEETGKLKLDDRLGKLDAFLKKSNKKDLTIREIFAHTSGLRPWIPFYAKTLDTKTKKPLSKIYKKKKSGLFTIPVAKGWFMNKNYLDSMDYWIAESELLDEKKYRYSDLGYYLMKRVLKKQFKKSLKKESHQLFAQIGADHLTYLPKEKFAKNTIVPTEKDDYFRHQTLVGDVHDMGAAMQGGIGGHAGMFSNARDLAKYMQMLLNKGHYGGKRYFEESTIETFTACQFCDENNRRAIGFDKPIVEEGPGGPTCEQASKRSFGHTGFTGTMVWAEPENGMVFIFLSNRTFPSMKNTKLVKMDVRTKIQEEFYKLLSLKK